MTQEEAVKHWLESAAENVKIADDMFKLRHYSWCLFMWHLAIEKSLKAKIASQEIEAPFIHDLFKLSKYAGINIDSANITKSDLDEITSFNLEARYEDYKHKFYERANIEYTNRWVPVCRKFYQDIINNINL